jgi:hypothetical protein
MTLSICLRRNKQTLHFEILSSKRALKAQPIFACSFQNLMKQSRNIFDESLLVTCLVVYYWHGCDKIYKRDSDLFFQKIKAEFNELDNRAG